MRHHVPKLLSVASALGVVMLAVVTQLVIRHSTATPDTPNRVGHRTPATDIAKTAQFAEQGTKAGLSAAPTTTSVRFGDAVPPGERMAALALVSEVEAYWREEAGIAVPEVQVALGINFDEDLAPLFAEWEHTSIHEGIQNWRLTKWSGYATYWHQRGQGGDVVSRHVYAHVPAQSWHDLTDPNNPLRTILVHEYLPSSRSRRNTALLE